MYLLTGITRMKQNRVCISVYDLIRKSYRRPINPRGHFYIDSLNGCNLFCIMFLKPHSTTPPLLRPHSEDFYIRDFRFHSQAEFDLDQQLEILQAISDPSVDSIFGMHNGKPALITTKESNYVLPNTGERSLGTIQAKRASVRAEGRRFRVNLTDMSGKEYRNIIYVGHQEISDINSLNYRLRAARYAFIRLSLSRPFWPTNWQTDACFLQVSGIHCY